MMLSKSLRPECLFFVIDIRTKPVENVNSFDSLTSVREQKKKNRFSLNWIKQKNSFRINFKNKDMSIQYNSCARKTMCRIHYEYRDCS